VTCRFLKHKRGDQHRAMAAAWPPAVTVPDS
jgi:hypothetical protein